MRIRTHRSRPACPGPLRRTAARAVAGTTAALLVGLVGLGVSPAVAAPSVGPSIEGYEPERPPSIDVTVLTPVCDGDVPYLEYEVVPTGTPNDTVTITWQNPDGDDVVMADLPLSGRVLWPGAEVDAQGAPLDWPGWHREDGEWVVGDEYDWVRAPVDVLFQVNPEATETVGYPPSSPDCGTNPPGTPEPTIKVDTLNPVCLAGVTYLDYGLTVTGTPARTATLTWHNPTGGPDFVHHDVPLRGRVLWPGAYPERFVDLPASEGWELVNNMWQNTRDFGWAVGTVDLTFTVNPEVTVPVTFPQGSQTCVRSAGLAGLLPRTGAEILRVAAVAVAFLALGTTALVLTRRRRA